MVNEAAANATERSPNSTFSNSTFDIQHCFGRDRACYDVSPRGRVPKRGTEATAAHPCLLPSAFCPLPSALCLLTRNSGILSRHDQVHSSSRFPGGDPSPRCRVQRTRPPPSCRGQLLRQRPAALPPGPLDSPPLHPPRRRGRAGLLTAGVDEPRIPPGPPR